MGAERGNVRSRWLSQLLTRYLYIGLETKKEGLQVAVHVCLFDS